MPNIAVALTGQGYIEDEVVKVLGGNWLRLLREVWQS
jgi:microsomal dipeptidase-like Zn-dependent dipeptidase